MASRIVPIWPSLPQALKFTANSVALRARGSQGYAVAPCRFSPGANKFRRVFGLTAVAKRRPTLPGVERRVDVGVSKNMVSSTAGSGGDSVRQRSQDRKQLASCFVRVTSWGFSACRGVSSSTGHRPDLVVPSAQTPRGTQPLHLRGSGRAQDGEATDRFAGVSVQRIRESIRERCAAMLPTVHRPLAELTARGHG